MFDISIHVHNEGILTLYTMNLCIYCEIDFPSLPNVYLTYYVSL